MKVIIFGGTTEGREAAVGLSDKGFDVWVSVASKTGESAMSENGDRGLQDGSLNDRIRIVVGRKELPELKAFLPGFDVCIDATHPYAERITKNLKEACEFTKTRYLRLLREKAAPVTDYVNTAYVSDPKEASEFIRGYLSREKGNILLTTGSKELKEYEGVEKNRVYVRVLPVTGSIEACTLAKIPSKNIIAMWGPFSEELNMALIRQLGIGLLVTKESGREGGFYEKVSASKKTGITLLIIKRPKEEGLTYEEILREL